MKRTMFAIVGVGLSLTLPSIAQHSPTFDTTNNATREWHPPLIYEPAGAERPSVSAESSSSGKTDEVKASFYLGPKLNELPTAVQNTIKREAKGQVIEDIDVETWNNGIVYDVEFKQEGLNRHVYIDPAGKLVTINEAAGAERTNRNWLDLGSPALP